MAERGNNNFMRYVYRGEEGEIIPRSAKIITVHESVRIIREGAFYWHPNIVEVTCHDKVEKIEIDAFRRCPRLRKVIVPGVKIVEAYVFDGCYALTDVECDELEFIGARAFSDCKSLKSINLSSIRIVGVGAFDECKDLMDAKFGGELERFEEWAFWKCTSLERITIPLKNGLIPHGDTFQGCRNLKLLELVDRGELHETIAALHLEEWSRDMNHEIYSINQSLPTADAGSYVEGVVGEKAQTIRTWIRSLLGEIGQYTAAHRRLLDEDVAPRLQHFVPRDIVKNSILPFLELPSNSFESGGSCLEGGIRVRTWR